MGAAAIKAKKEKKKENFLKSHIILKINELPIELLKVKRK